MQLKLSCYCCGSEDFEHTEIEGLLEIEGRSYLLHEEIKNNVVICKKWFYLRFTRLDVSIKDLSELIIEEKWNVK